MKRHLSQNPSPWLIRFGALFPPGLILDVACGRGRHTRWLRDRGYKVTAVDLDVSALSDFQGDSNVEIIKADLEKPCNRSIMAKEFEGILTTNYLYRPLLIPLVETLKPGGILLYETFAVGHEKYGRPKNPDYLLKRGELLELAAGRLHVLAYEHIRLPGPNSAMVQRICARKAPA